MVLENSWNQVVYYAFLDILPLHQATFFLRPEKKIAMFQVTRQIVWKGRRAENFFYPILLKHSTGFCAPFRYLVWLLVFKKEFFQ